MTTSDDKHGRVQGVGEVEERSLNDVLSNPYVVGGALIVAGKAVDAVVDKIKGGQAEPPLQVEDEG